MSRILPVQDPARPEDHGGPRTAAVDTIVIHTTEGGSIDGAEGHWDREDVTASAHYVLDGETVDQVVDEGIIAWHCGNRAMHQRSIGIEVVGLAGDPRTWSVAVLTQLVALCADVVERHAIPVTHGCPGILGHAEVPCPTPGCPGRWGGASHHTDPGPHFPWQAFLAALEEELLPDPPHEQRFPSGPAPAKGT